MKKYKYTRNNLQEVLSEVEGKFRLKRGNKYKNSIKKYNPKVTIKNTEP